MSQQRSRLAKQTVATGAEAVRRVPPPRLRAAAPPPPAVRAVPLPQRAGGGMNPFPTNPQKAHKLVDAQTARHHPPATRRPAVANPSPKCRVAVAYPSPRCRVPVARKSRHWCHPVAQLSRRSRLPGANPLCRGRLRPTHAHFRQDRRTAVSPDLRLPRTAPPGSAQYARCPTGPDTAPPSRDTSG